jgi:hypothetical protein
MARSANYLALTRDMFKEAAKARLTFTKYLESLMPPPDGSSLDAFQLQMKERGIVTKSNYAQGISASIVEDAFYHTEDNDILFPEFVARTVREAIVSDTILPYLIGQYTTINSNSYKTVYCDDQPTKASLRRVTESSELPRTKMVTRTQEVKIYKYGRAIEASYEVIRRMQIDLLALHIRRIGIQAAKDKVAEILTVIESGDGNNNAAETLNLTALDTDASAGTLTAKGFIAFLMEFEEFPCTTLIAEKSAFLQLVLTNLGTYTATDVLRLLTKGATEGINLSMPQLPSGNMRLFWDHTATIGSGKVLGINQQYAVEQVTEAGSDIQEADSFITNQTKILTLSENNGYSKIFKEATKLLNIGA